MSKSCSTFQECCLYFTSNSLTRHMNTMAERAFAITGLSPSYGHLMLLLIEEPGLSQSELSKRMNVKASTMTRFIDKLLGVGHVERVQEGRNTYIFPTEQGKELKPVIDQALSRLFKMYCEVLGEDFAVKLTEDMHQANMKLQE